MYYKAGSKVTHVLYFSLKLFKEKSSHFSIQFSDEKVLF